MSRWTSRTVTYWPTHVFIYGHVIPGRQYFLSIWLFAARLPVTQRLFTEETNRREADRSLAVARRDKRNKLMT